MKFEPFVKSGPSMGNIDSFSIVVSERNACKIGTFMSTFVKNQIQNFKKNYSSFAILDNFISMDMHQIKYHNNKNLSLEMHVMSIWQTSAWPKKCTLGMST